MILTNVSYPITAIMLRAISTVFTSTKYATTIVTAITTLLQFTTAVTFASVLQYLRVLLPLFLEYFKYK